MQAGAYRMHPMWDDPRPAGQPIFRGWGQRKPDLANGVL
jgi:hypothetical protein